MITSQKKSRATVKVVTVVVHTTERTRFILGVKLETSIATPASAGMEKGFVGVIGFDVRGTVQS